MPVRVFDAVPPSWDSLQGARISSARAMREIVRKHETYHACLALLGEPNTFCKVGRPDP
jgi:hypothetical protein